MPVVWKLSAPSTGTLTDAATLDVENLVLRRVNQAVDTLTFDDPSTQFDAALRWPIDTALVLARNDGSDIVWFRGTVRDAQRIGNGADMRIRYRVDGPWQWLERTPYLQLFKVPSDPTNPSSSLVNQARGRVVLGQAGDGTKVYLGGILGSILAQAISAGAPIAYTALTLNQYVPWEEATDLSCAEALQRVLRWRPDLVCWWDYTVNPPSLNFTPQASLSTISLAVQPAGTTDAGPYAPLESVQLRTRPDLAITSAYLLYLQTNRDNEATWETVTVDKFPATGFSEGAPDQLLRTIQLAGSVAQSSVLTQRCAVDPLAAGLVYDNPIWLKSGSQFDTLRSWWWSHAPELNTAYATIKGFAKCLREGDSMGTGGQLNSELVTGAITDWMLAGAGIASEEQRVSAYIAVEIKDPKDSTKTRVTVQKYVARITATNAQTKTYSYLQASSYTPPEAVPTGLAQALYNAFSVAPHEGSVVLVEPDCSYAVTVGRALLLTGSLAAWSTMQAIVQSAEYDLQLGRTVLQLGPPKQLGLADLIDVFRNNRSNPPVTSYLTRTTGKSGIGTTAQGLPVNFQRNPKAAPTVQPPTVYTVSLIGSGVVPSPANLATKFRTDFEAGDIIVTEGDQINVTSAGSLLRLNARVTYTNPGSLTGWKNISFTVDSVTIYAQLRIVPSTFNAAISIAGVVPTSTELINAIKGCFETPGCMIVDGDTVALTVSGVVKFKAILSLTAVTTSGLFVVSFTSNSVTYYAVLNQTGIY